MLADRYRTGRYSRVDQRAVSLLLAAVGSELKEDLISLRLLGTSAIVFRVITKYQPGGSSEKQQLLSFLVSPDAVTTASGAVKGSVNGAGGSPGRWNCVSAFLTHLFS